MADKKPEELEITRRQFMAGAGIVIAIGAVSNLVAAAATLSNREF